MKRWFQVRVNDVEDSMSYSEVVQAETLREATLAWFKLFYDSCDVPLDCLIQMHPTDAEHQEFSILIPPAEEVFTGYVEEIQINERKRDERLVEILRKQSVMPPDRFDMARTEGYNAEEIAIFAIDLAEGARQ